MKPVWAELLLSSTQVRAHIMMEVAYIHLRMVHELTLQRSGAQCRGTLSLLVVHAGP